MKQDHRYDFREGKQGPPPLKIALSNEREGKLGPLDRLERVENNENGEAEERKRNRGIGGAALQ